MFFYNIRNARLYNFTKTDSLLPHTNSNNNNNNNNSDQVIFATALIFTRKEEYEKARTLLEQLLHQPLDNVLRVQIYGLLCEVYGRLEDTDSAIAFGKQQFNLSERDKFEAGKVDASINLTLHFAHIDFELMQKIIPSSIINPKIKI